MPCGNIDMQTAHKKPRYDKKGVCRNGHRLVPGNIYIAPGDQRERCLICCRACRNRRSKAQEKGYKSQLDVRIREAIRKRLELADTKQRPKHEARWIARRAVLNGSLIKHPCEKCGSQKSEAHHDNYSKPLGVRWLCRKHHIELHRAYREGTVAPDGLPSRP